MRLIMPSSPIARLSMLLGCCALASSTLAAPLASAEDPLARSGEPDLIALDAARTAAANQRIRHIMASLERKQFAEALSLARQVVATEPNNPVGYSLQAAAHAGSNDLEGARRSLLAALQVSPSDATALMNLAQLDLKAGDGQAAQERLQTVLAGSPEHLAAMLGMAKIASRRGRHDQAIQWLTHARRSHPDSVMISVATGEVLLDMREPAKAMDELNTALQNAPGHPLLLETLGRAHLAAGEISRALQIYSRLAAAHPRWALAHQRMATAQIAFRNPTAALASLRTAVQLEPDNIETLAMLGSLELANGQAAEALARAEQIRRVAPDSAMGLILKGDALLAQRETRLAQNAYESAWAMAQSGALAIRLHKVRQHGAKQAIADHALLQWLDAKPGDELVRDYLAGEYLRTGRTAAAIEQYQRLLRSNPRNLVALNNLALAYHRNRDPRAVATAEEAMMIAPQSAAIADTLGWILFERGDQVRGLELLRTAASLGPELAEIRFHFAAALARTGDKAAARRELEKLLKAFPRFPQRETAQALLLSL